MLRIGLVLAEMLRRGHIAVWLGFAASTSGRLGFGFDLELTLQVAADLGRDADLRNGMRCLDDKFGALLLSLDDRSFFAPVFQFRLPSACHQGSIEVRRRALKA